MDTTYRAIDGPVLWLAPSPGAEEAFFQRALDAYATQMDWLDFGYLIHSVDNPPLVPTKGYVTKKVWDLPLFQALIDLEGRLGLQQGGLKPEGKDPWTDPLEDEWVPSVTASEEHGVTLAALHLAIQRGEVIAKPAKEGGKRLVVSRNSLNAWQPSAVRQRAGRLARTC